MRAIRAAILRRLAHDAGFTVVEVLVVTMSLSFVLVALISLASTSQKQAPKDEERVHALRTAQVGLHRMTRELRQSHDFVSWNAYVIDANVRLNGVDKRVVYKCDEPHPTDSAYHRCVRYEVASNGSTTPQETVIDRVSKVTVFAYPQLKGGKPLYVTARVEVPTKGDLKDGFKYRDVFEDGFYLRNRNLG